MHEGTPASLPLCPPHVLHGPTTPELHPAIRGGKSASEGQISLYGTCECLFFTHSTETRGHTLSELGFNLRFQISSC